MLQLIANRLPAHLHRRALPLAHAIRVRWWRWRRPMLLGIRVMAINASGELLLVRHSYGSRRWTLPGGAVGRGETAIAAATRELAEETDCALRDPVEIAVTSKIWHGTTNVIHVIAGTTADTPRADGREIVAARWFARNALPVGINRSVAGELPKWLSIALDGAEPSE